MGRFKVVDQDNFEPGVGMTMDPNDEVERDCYRDTETQVMDFINAGERLADFRRGEFDHEYEEVDELEIPITRTRDFDIATGSMILESEAERLSKLSPAEAEKAKEDPEKAEPAKQEAKNDEAVSGEA